ncbi:MAG TPA: SIS domain-containing protein [Candidatus Limnocylindrales bacterium]|nr:SIS domain-containing protein [Candidatus Limnocylindrales bacterium]
MRERLRADGPDAMGRETAEGPAGVAATLRGLGTGGSAARSLVDGAARLALVGTGASLAVAETAAPLFGGRAIVREASQAALAGSVGASVWGGARVAVVISMSGKSPESRAAAERASREALPVVAVTADPASPLAAGADAVVATPIGEETGAATKSAVAAFAALAALAGALATDGPSVETLARALESTVADLEPALACGPVVGRSVAAWALGFGPALGLARAEATLLHEKARRPTVFATPSEFRHGPIEAATSDDVVVLFDVDLDRSPARDRYLARLAEELAALKVPLVRVGTGAAANLPLPGSVPPAERILHAFVRAQQLARVAAHVRGTYADEFLVLRSIVRAADDLIEG